MNKIVKEKEEEIQNLKKQLKLPAESVVQTILTQNYPSRKGSFAN